MSLLHETATRREFIDRFVIRPSASALVLPYIVPHLPDFASPGDTQESETQRLVQEILAREQAIGRRPINMGGVKPHVDLMAELFARSNGLSSQSAYELASSTFVVLGDWREEQEISINHPNIPVMEREPIAQFQRDYPNHPLTPQNAQLLLRGLNGSLRGEFIQGRGTFLYLSAFNDPRSQHALEFSASENGLSCGVAAPIVRLRSVVAHEYFHAISMGEREPVSPVLFDAIVESEQDAASAVFRGNQTDDIEVRKSAFIVYIRAGNRGTVRNRFNEFTADYLKARLFERHNMPYTEGSYASHRDTDNFGRVLAASNLLDDGLMHQFANQNIEEFLLALGRGARNISAENDKDLMKFAYDLAIRRNLAPLYWPFFQDYYPNLDMQTYYHLSPINDESRSDCQIVAY